MSKRISRLASSVQNPPAYWRDKSATLHCAPFIKGAAPILCT